MELSGIKNIIFDFGGVILNIDYLLTEQQFQALGLDSFAEIYSQFNQNDLFDQLETGQIEPQTFRDALRPHLAPHTTDQQIDEAWNAMLLDHPAERLAALRALKPQFRTFMLSNTNAIHYDAFLAILKREHNLDGLDELFEKVYYSHAIGRRKPHPETFTWVLEQHGLMASETLFIDDSPQHVEGARKAGLKAYHLQKGEEITALFRDFLT